MGAGLPVPVQNMTVFPSPGTVYTTDWGDREIDGGSEIYQVTGVKKNEQ